jgi:hypothetical protein
MVKPIVPDGFFTSGQRLPTDIAVQQRLRYFAQQPQEAGKIT